MSTNLVQEAMNKMNRLPLDKQREVLDFVEFIAQRKAAVDAPYASGGVDDAKPPRRLLKGDLAHLESSVTSEDIEEARREMWRGYMDGDG